MNEYYRDLSEANVRDHVEHVKADPDSKPEGACELCAEATRLGLWEADETT